MGCCAGKDKQATYHEMDYTSAWKECLSKVGKKSWVLFKNGTVVVMESQGGDISSEAISILRRDGPVIAGSPHGDFNVITVDVGIVVTCHNKDIMTMVLKEEIDSKSSNDMVTGLYGRNKRDMDSKECEVIHVETVETN